MRNCGGVSHDNTPDVLGARKHRLRPLALGCRVEAQMTDLPDYPDLGRGPFIQRALDALSVVFGLLFILVLAASVPLAIALMMIAEF